MSRGRQFRDLLRRGGLTIAPGAYDCITARSIVRAGFGAVYMTGAGTAATLGYPDNDDFKQFYPLSVMETGGEIL